MICEKCGAEIHELSIGMFDREGNDSEQSIYIVDEDEETGAVWIDADSSWTGYGLTEEEQAEIIGCPKCGKFPFKCREVQVYEIVRIVCFKEVQK